MSGRFTIPTDLDVVPETLALMKKWGADAIRNADGTAFPKELADIGAKVYATYFTTRKDNLWARQNPDEVQQCYISTAFHTSQGGELSICLLEGLSADMLAVNDIDDITRWWEVIDRTAGSVVPPEKWGWSKETEKLTIKQTTPYHAYSVSFLAYLIWDPVHMYNAVVNDWQDVERQITFDVRQPKTHAFSKDRLRKFLRVHPYVDVVRFTTFFHQFTLLFDELRREKYVDWYGYSASVSPYILEKFEKEYGYRFRAEFIIDQGYYNNQYRVPSKEYLDFMAFQRREVAALAKELVEIVHEESREAMMFLGDHWIGTEPYQDEFKDIGLDAIVGSVGGGSTLRLISEIEGVRYIEGRLLPYFFPDTFYQGGDPVREAKKNWLAARRAILRKPIDRIGYGGYLKLALQFPEFVDYVAKVADEFRDIYEKTRSKPLCFARVAILNCWGRSRSWGCHMVHHAIYFKSNAGYAGIFEILSGSPFDVSFINFDEVNENPELLKQFDVVVNVGDAGTAHGGGVNWSITKTIAAVRKYIAEGGGFIGVGEPSAYQREGRFFQLSDALGVELERGLTLGYDKYNRDVKEHFITQDIAEGLDFGDGKCGVYATTADILAERGMDVQMAANTYFSGRSVYISGLLYNAINTRTFLRAVLWACRKEAVANKWMSADPRSEMHIYPNDNRYCVVNNTDEVLQTAVRANNKAAVLKLSGGEIRWFDL